MEVKKIVEGMTAPQVAQVIDDNFKAQNAILEEDIAKQNSVIGVSEYKDFSEAEAVNVGDVRKYNGLLYECVEATTGAFDASKWKKSSFKAETEKKLSELGSELYTLESIKDNSLLRLNFYISKNNDVFVWKETADHESSRIYQVTDGQKLRITANEGVPTIIYWLENVDNISNDSIPNFASGTERVRIEPNSIEDITAPASCYMYVQQTSSVMENFYFPKDIEILQKTDNVLAEKYEKNKQDIETINQHINEYVDITSLQIRTLPLIIKANTGTWADGSCKIYQVNEGDKIRVTANDYNKCIIRWLNSYDTAAVGVVPDIVEGTDKVVIESGKVSDVTVPFSCYMYVSGNHYEAKLIELKINSIENLYKEIKSLKNDTYSYSSILNNQKEKLRYYIQGSSGVWKETDKVGCRIYKVEKGQKIKIVADKNVKSIVRWINSYDNLGNDVPADFVEGIESVYVAPNTYAEIEIQQSCYMYVAQGVKDIQYLPDDILLLTLKGTSKKIFEGLKSVWTGGSTLYGSGLQNLKDAYPYVVSEMLGMSCVSYGIGGTTSCRREGDYDGVYLDYNEWISDVEKNLVDKTKKYLVKDDISVPQRPYHIYEWDGSKWTYIGETNPSSEAAGRTPLVDRIAEMDKDADVIVVSPSEGNSWFYEWGTLGDINSEEDRKDVTTHVGAMFSICQYLVDTYPNKVIMLLSPIAAWRYQPKGLSNARWSSIAPDMSNPSGNTAEMYAEVTRKIAGWFGILYYEVNKEANLTPYTDWWVADIDGKKVHQNKEGHRKVAELVANKLLMLKR